MTANEWAAICVAVGTLIGFLVTGVRFLVKSYLSELKPNGGNSVRDRIDSITCQVDRLEARIDLVNGMVQTINLGALPLFPGVLMRLA